MTQPTFAQYKAPSTNAAGLQYETVQERMLTCLAVFMSGQNPDGTTVVLPHP